ncbi:unnamed protein product [Meloidogyne enterolobii]|uniref:Uncharacterized protein n=2 Tax=Meloidogyne enterolobii TaxID=390850 RepID=A0ACB0XRX6_MELEN
MNWKFILIYLIFYLNISISVHIPTILDHLSSTNAKEFIQKMEIEFKNPLNVPIVFRFRIALFLCIWKKSSTVKFSLLRHIVTNARTALIDKEDKGDLSGKILNNINLYTNYKKLNAKSQQVNELTEFRLLKIIEGLLSQLVPIDEENELPWEQSKDKALHLMRIIKDLEYGKYGERKFKTTVTKKLREF